MNKKYILLVDDNVLDAQMISKVLFETTIQSEVQVLPDGAEALDFLFRRGKFKDREIENPILILLDLKMPKVNGFQVLREIRNDENLRIIPIVVLTSSKEDGDLLKSYRLGAAGYVVKPVDFEEFNSAIRALGVFWIKVNQPPPQPVETLPQVA
jgi:CheY-like chemotaxis protein